MPKFIRHNKWYIWTHMEFWWLEAEVGEGVAQLPLRLHHLGQLIGQRLSQLDYLLVLSLVVAEDFDLSLQLHVHSPGAPTQLLWQDLPGTLQRTAGLLTHTDKKKKKTAGNFYFSCCKRDSQTEWSQNKKFKAKDISNHLCGWVLGIVHSSANILLTERRQRLGQRAERRSRVEEGHKNKSRTERITLYVLMLHFLTRSSFSMAGFFKSSERTTAPLFGCAFIGPGQLKVIHLVSDLVIGIAG